MPDDCPACKERIEQETNSRWEQHSQSVLAAIIVALLVWVGYSVSKNTTAIAVMGHQFNAMQSQMNFMQTQLTAANTNNYTSTDALRDFGRVNKQLDELKVDVKEIGKEQQKRGPRIKRLEDYHGKH